MGRRKRIFSGQNLGEQFDTALGFPEHQRAQDILSKSGVETPKIDWSKTTGQLGF